MDINQFYTVVALPLAWIADRIIGDPSWLPHPIVGFGKLIAWGEKKWNKGNKRTLKGGCWALILILSSFFFMHFITKAAHEIDPFAGLILSVTTIFFCLAGKTLITEVKQVFLALDLSVEKGRTQVARIVGRDTSNLSSQQIRTAALETLAENLSDGVIAPVFWYLVLGLPGMFAYKMVNTLDSMIGYKNERYKQFGCWAAIIDDIANYIPARLTAVIMVLVSGRFSAFTFIKKYGNKHASPNSGYPEAALAGILNCRFGGPNVYFGQIVDKPYIGEHPKSLTTQDMTIATDINFKTELVAITLATAIIYYFAV
ncbi:adenosylcobinamide-phosphate synthase CbiB [Odoribacter sp. OttesenSCG-928-J03]|nr:adenosylcobinamide-phosphate synthase CbiB [Odoribacter sp. OttesenSCG-928-J03]MDL2330532.1 adenosylcobinamide-phosphate synthase CbiB [Odoribacter sp. OttesenSCG-928-A06]